MLIKYYSKGEVENIKLNWKYFCIYIKPENGSS